MGLSNLATTARGRLRQDGQSYLLAVPLRFSFVSGLCLLIFLLEVYDLSKSLRHENV